LGGDEGGVAVDGRRREEEEGVGGEGLERHNDAQNNSERGRRVGGRRGILESVTNLLPRQISLHKVLQKESVTNLLDKSPYKKCYKKMSC
jgi:hypothetical protein